MQTCNSCGQEKVLSEYYHKTIRDKPFVTKTCKECCRRKIADKIAKESPEQKRIRLDKMKTYAKNNAAVIRKKSWKAKGIDPDKAEAYYQSHHGTCDLCGLTDKGRALAVDHCHKTGIIRGMLCTNCNRAIGMFKDDPDLMIKAANYVRANQKAELDEL